MPLRRLCHLLVIRPLARLFMGLNVSGAERLPQKGPAIVVANHRSHADTIALLSLFDSSAIGRVRAVAASDYFSRDPVLNFITSRCLGTLALDRAARARGEDPLLACVEALDRGEILIVYPQGTRGQDGERLPFKKGIAHLAERRPLVPIIPVLLSGTERVLPKGSVVPVPFCCDVAIGERFGLHATPANRDAFIAALEAAVYALGARQHSPPAALPLAA